MDKTVKCPCGNIVKKGQPKLIEIAQVCDCSCHENGDLHIEACCNGQCEKCKRNLIWS